ncbi:MAG: hypothetical protein RL732_786 [Bacteroidota bacterium]|jgi:anti-anti-sigma factor
MEVKIDTKEKFHRIHVITTDISANMAGELRSVLTKPLQAAIKNVILDMGSVTRISPEAAEEIVRIQQEFYEKEASFVICCLTAPVEQFLEEASLLEMMNVTPTESEAMDIIHMEEIERELLGDE